jgi:hypothetical protein
MNPSRVIRRAHLFVGLFLAPWVLIFGLSALVIHNHGALSGWPRRIDVPAPAIASAVTQLPAPEAIARQVVTALNAAHGSFTLAADAPRFDGPLNLNLNWGADAGKAVVFPDPLGGRINRYKPAAPVRRFPTLIPPALDRPTLTRLRDDLAGAFQKADPTITKLGPLGVPQVRFAVTEGGREFTAVCDLATGSLTLTPTERAIGDFLQKLHMTHKYISGPWYRFAWLIFANLVGLALCFWVVTGVVMWWRSGTSRGAGLAALAVTSAAVAVVVASLWLDWSAVQ